MRFGQRRHVPAIGNTDKSQIRFDFDHAINGRLIQNIRPFPVDKHDRPIGDPFKHAPQIRTVIVGEDHVPLDRAEVLLDMHDEVTELLVFGEEFEKSGALLEAIEGAGLADGIATARWENIGLMRSMTPLFDGIMALLLFAILLVAGAGLLNTMLMSVLERQREIGVLLALGLSRPKIVGSIVSEAGIFALAGSAIDASPDTTPSVSTATLPPASSSAARPAPAPVATASPEPVRHKVVRGETAYTVARLYDVPIKSLAEWNGLGSDFTIREGQYLLIPVAGAAAPARTVQTAAAVTEPGQGSPTPVPPSASKPLPDEKVAARTDEVAQEVSVGKPTATSSAQMDFPVKGKIIRTYTKGKNEGIDIAASPGAAVTAAKDGSVAAITSSADQVPIVVVRHADNLLTVYANVENIKVKKGDPVSRGQQIAQLRGGSNSYVHFEVRNGFDSVNPMPYLE